jgi:glucose/mannose transport system permease protein
MQLRLQVLGNRPMAESTIQGGARASLSPTTRKRRWPTWLRGDTLIAVIVLLPSIIAVAIFIYSFILWTGYISTVKWNSPIQDFTFVGLDNWSQLFQMERFRWDLRNLVLYALGFMSQCIIFGFLIAVLLDQKIKGEALFRTVVIFPFAVSAIVTGVAWRWLMQPTTGLNLLFAKLGFAHSDFAWNADPRWGILAISLAASWQFTGYVMALYLAGLRGIPSELREAAAIDGAGTIATYRHVIIPLLMPVTFTVLVLTGMNSIRVFDLVTMLAGPAFTTDTLGFHMYQATFGMYRFSLGAALGFFMIFLSLFLVVPYLMSMRREVER